MTKRVFLILGDQLSFDHPFLITGQAGSPSIRFEADDRWVMIESIPRAEWLPYHPQKLLYLFTCMRRFAVDMRSHSPDKPIHYIKASNQTFADCLNDLSCDEVHVIEPSEPRVKKWLTEGLKPKLVVHPSPFFLGKDSFLPAKPPYLMENFYRKMRSTLKILMVNGEPAGGQWNYDADNRQPPTKTMESKPPEDFLARDWLDAEDKKIMADVETMLREFIPAQRFGDWSWPRLPTHQKSARAFLADFIKDRLSFFGPYEDAMLAQSVGLYHSGLSAIMNIQLLSAREILRAAENAQATVPLSSREGFIRQVLGWREFVRLIYLRHNRDYQSSNFFGFNGELPPAFWGAQTDLFCLATIVRQVRENAYSHHIPRLMVLGNFALLTQTDPHAVNRWFWSVYLDAYEWVVSPNVLGMSQFADGGLFATKPYVSGANYIKKMSNFCKSCRFDPQKTVGEGACPFNSLYWSFIDDTQRLNVQRPSFTRRMSLMWSLWNKKSDEEKNLIRSEAKKYRDQARCGKL
jgi:deoxyribodipyrimidine photolyase-related protein